ncbi:MAG: DMT family transporter [Rhodospirillales bacterium]|nr:DMT family transporter [Rhodospirillales bacterium]
MSGTLRGMAFMVLATLALIIMGTIARTIATELHAIEVAFFRSLFGFLVFLPFFVRYGWGPLKTERLGLHALRGLLQAVALLTAFVGLSLIPLAKYVALDFSAPLFATLLAILLLGEPLRFRRVAALAVGFAGALVIVRPGFIEFDTGTLCMLIAAASWGIALVVIKVLTRTDSSVTLTIYSTIFTTPIALVAAMFVWQWPTASQLAWLLLVGALGSFAHVCQAQAFKEGDVTAIMPLEFLKLVWASVLGYLVFAEVVDVWTWVGGAMIFGSAMTAGLSEGRARVPATEPLARAPGRQG